MTEPVPESVNSRIEREQEAWKQVRRLASELYQAAEGLARIGGETPFDGVMTTVWRHLLLRHGVPLGSNASASFELGFDLPTDRSRGGITTSTRLAVFKRDEFRCMHCRTTENLTIDHIYPRSRGGGNEINNLQTLCQTCNSRKGASV